MNGGLRFRWLLRLVPRLLRRSRPYPLGLRFVPGRPRLPILLSAWLRRLRRRLLSAGLLILRLLSLCLLRLRLLNMRLLSQRLLRRQLRCMGVRF
jgi:hypothetical protein